MTIIANKAKTNNKNNSHRESTRSSTLLTAPIIQQVDFSKPCSTLEQGRFE
jgi:hypothetical protein